MRKLVDILINNNDGFSIVDPRRSIAVLHRVSHFLSAKIFQYVRRKEEKDNYKL